MTEKTEQLILKNFTLPGQGERIEYRGVVYTIGNEIGKGSFGVVYECTDEWGNELAAKLLLPRSKPYEIIKDNWNKELANLITFRNPNITFVYSAFEYRDSFYIITERCHKTLRDLILIPDYNGLVWVLPIARCLLQAVEFLHSINYVHKDIHLGNVFTSLIKDELIPQSPPAIKFKLGDLGISNLVNDIDVFNTILAEWMLPPEYLNPSEFGTVDKRLDIYHCGLLFLHLIKGEEITFNKEEILKGKPREMAEGLPPPFNFALSKALRRHVSSRTQTPMELWRDLHASSSAS